MAKPRLLPWSTYLSSTLLLLVLAAARPLFGRSAMPNSSRECAICHIRWVGAFARIGPQEGVMQAVLERQAGSGDMCLSCHDGSVTDSRFKVWSTRHHTTDSVPSPAVSIPTEKFPLDAQGRMTCATCHTAHAVPDSSDLKTVIFLRQPNVDSSLCLNCHPEHAQKSDCQHPLGRSDSPVPQVILDAGGKTSADGHAVFCQTCHEPHGARNAWMLVLPPSKLCIACHTDKTPETTPPAGAPVHSIGHTYLGFEPPGTLLDEKATFGPNGELGCLSCHRLHDASGTRPLLIRKNEDSSLCLECHKKEAAVIESPHDLRRSSPETVNAGGETPSVSGPCGACHRIHGWARDVPETSRPHSSGCMECHKTGGPGSLNRPYVDAHAVGTALSEGMSTELPLDSATNSIGCLTCHDPHSPRSSEIGAEGELPTTPLQVTGSQVPAPRSFLRHEGSRLCVLCHDKIGNSPQAPHDPAEFAAAVRRELTLHPSVGPCRVCHTTHNARGPHLWVRAPATDSGSLISDLCGACHEDRLGAQGSVHDPGASEWASELGFVSKGSCIDCHPVHGQSEEDSIWASLGAEEAPAHLCETCHRTGGPGKAMETPHVGRTLANDPQNLPGNLAVGPDRRILCTTCHDIHQKGQGPKLLRAPISDLCGACHEDKLGVQDSVHDPATSEWARELGLVSRGLCIDCHPVHGPRGKSGIWATIGGEGASAQSCETCHRTGAPGKAMKTPHMGETLADDIQSLPENMAVSSDGQILCTTCHDIHRKGQSPKLLAVPRQDSGLCLACHAEVGGLLGTPHDLRTSAPDAGNVRGEIAAESGPCGSCHLAHSASDEGGVWAHGSTSEMDFGSSLCTCCHRQGECAGSRVPEYVDHPEVALLNRTPPRHPGYMPTFDSSGERSRTGAISCLTCHEPHAARVNPEARGKPVPAHRGMFLRSTEHRGLCVDCHGVETLWRFLYYHKEHRNPHAERNVNSLSPRKE
jgi:predicted CXXCH cytochrome family protein